MKKCTGENCPMQMGYDFENCAAIEKCPYRTWPVTIADRIRSMTDNELIGLFSKFRSDAEMKHIAGISTMETEKMSYEPMEIDRVPYMGLPDCKDCPEKRSTVIEHRLYGNSGCVAVDTHVECAKLDLCLKLKQRLMESLRDWIICGEGDSKPLGLSRAEPPADG